MADKNALLKQRAEKAKAKALEFTRKAQAAEKALLDIERREDTRRKILAGSWILDKAERMPELRKELMRELDAFWLIRDDDRELFGFAVLSDPEKEKRSLALKARLAKQEGAQASSDAARAPDASVAPVAGLALVASH